MTMQNFQCLIQALPWLHNSNPVVASAAMADGGDRVSKIFQIPKDGTITDVVFYINTDTASQDLGVRIVTIDTSGDPTTTAYGGMTAGTLALASVAVGRHEVTLGTSATANQGDLVAVDFYWPGTEGSIAIRAFADNSLINATPLTKTFNGSAWTDTGHMCMVSLKYSDGSYATPLFCTPPITTLTRSLYWSINTGTTPDELGIKYTPPVKCRLYGLGLVVREAGGTSDTVKIILYDSTDTILAYATQGGTGTNAYTYDEAFQDNVDKSSFFVFDTPVTLAAGSVYRIAILPGTATSISIGGFLYANAADREGFGFGLDATETERTDAGSWSDNADEMLHCALFFDQMDDGAGGGSPAIPGNMSGGMQ